MKKNRLIIFMALLITASISGLSVVHADITHEPQIDSNNILTISGKTADGYTPVTLKIYEAGTDVTNADFNNLSDIYYHIREIVSSSNGSYEFEIPLKGAEKQFNIRIKEGQSTVIERSIAFINNMADEAMKELKAADNIEAVKTAVNKFLSAVEFGFELYNDNKEYIENSDLLYKVIDSVKDTEVNSQSELMNLTEYATVMHALANADNIEAFTGIFDKYSIQIFASDSHLADLYNNKLCTGDSVKADIMQRLYGKQSDAAVYSDKGKFRALLQESIILSCCGKNRGYEVFDSIADVLAKIYKDDSDFITSYNRYKSLSEAKRNEAALEIIGHSFSSSAEAVNKIKEAIAKAGTSGNANSSSNQGGGSSGGGGGGGTGTGFVSAAGNKTASESEVNTNNVNNTISVNIPQKTVTTVEFNDLGNVEWAVDSILDLASRQIVNGKEENIFSPFDYVTREEFLKMLVSAIGIPVGNDKCSFNDVSENAWYYKYVAAGYANGIIKGIDDTNFGQGRFISRQDLAAMVGRAMKKIGIDLNSQNQTGFADDNEISDYAKEIVYSLKASGLINGKENNMFDPMGSTTRAEAAKIISSMIGYIEKSAQAE